MIKKFMHPARREIMAAVLSIALLAGPRVLFSQSNEQNAGAPRIGYSRNSASTVPEYFIPGVGRMVVKRDDSPSYSSVSAIELNQMLSQLRKQYADNPNEDEILVEITQREGNAVTNVTVNGNTHQVPGNNPAVSIMYGLLGMPKQPEPVSMDRITAPVLIHKIEPIYPETAKDANISGDVILRVTADEKGETIWVSAIDGHPYLAEAAIAAVSQWRYEPALSFEGKQIQTTFGVLIRYLQDRTIYSEYGSAIVISED